MFSEVISVAFTVSYLYASWHEKGGALQLLVVTCLFPPSPPFHSRFSLVTKCQFAFPSATQMLIMASLDKVKLDSATIASLDEILDLRDLSIAWTRSGEESPPFCCSPNSPSSPCDLDLEENEMQDDYLNIPSEGGKINCSSSPVSSPKGSKKRGRKPLRPFDPVKKKTEEKDKYWLRSFRGYMKTNYQLLRVEMTAEDRAFWREHLGPEGKPEKGRRYVLLSFLSYGRSYKDYLFSNSSFTSLFQRWFAQEGARELEKKYGRGSDLWFVFYDFAEKELLNYVPKDVGALGTNELFDMDMVDAEDLADSLLSK